MKSWGCYWQKCRQLTGWIQKFANQVFASDWIVPGMRSKISSPWVYIQHTHHPASHRWKGGCSRGSWAYNFITDAIIFRAMSSPCSCSTPLCWITKLPFKLDIRLSVLSPVSGRTNSICLSWQSTAYSLLHHYIWLTTAVRIWWCQQQGGMHVHTRCDHRNIGSDAPGANNSRNGIPRWTRTLREPKIWAKMRKSKRDWWWNLVWKGDRDTREGH